MMRQMIETRKRGFFGYFMLTLFWTLNAFMAAWMIVAWHVAKTGKDTEAATIAATGILLMFWFFVAGITGLLCYMTRGRKVTVIIDIPDDPNG